MISSSALVLRSLSGLLVFLPALLTAQTWNGTGADSNFSTAANWTGGSAPVNDGTAAVTLSGSTRTSPTLDANYSVNSLTIDSSSSFTLGGSSTLTLGNTLNSGGSASNHYIDTPIAIGGDLAIASTTAFLYLRGAISGTGDLTLTGSGRVIFGADSTFTGKVTANNGTVWFGYYGVSSGGSIVGNVALGGTSNMSIYRTNDLTYSGSISGSSTSNYVTLHGAGASGNIVTTFTGSNTYAGTTQIYGGATLKIGAENTLATTNSVRVQSTGLLWVAENQTLNGVDNNFDGHVLIDAGKTLTLSNASSYFGGSTMDMTGGGRLVKTGAGNYNFSGGNINLPAGITVTQGTFGIQGTATVTGPIENNATVDFNPNTSTPATYAGILSGTGIVTKTGSGTLTLENHNTYTGNTTVSAGLLNVTGSLANTSVFVANGATLGGTGSIGGLAQFSFGATLAPGASPGTLTFTNGLTLNSGSILNFELGTTSDLIVVNGGTATFNSLITLNLADAGGFGGGTYNLIDGTSSTISSYDATRFKLGTVIDGYTYALNWNGNLLQLTASVSAIPEPATCSVLAGLLALGLAGNRRRRAPLA